MSPCSEGLNKNEPPHGLCSVEMGEECLKLQESLLLKIGLLPPTSLGNRVPPPVPFPEAQNSKTTQGQIHEELKLTHK